MGYDRRTKIEFLPDRVGSALRAARATSLRIGDWSADGVDVMRSLSSVLKHGITILEFSAFLGRQSQAPADLNLDGVADHTLSQLVDAGTLEIDPHQGLRSADRRLYRLSPMGERVLKDRRARQRRVRDRA